MMDAPARLIIKRSEQRIMHRIANFDNGSTNKLAKPFLVAEFFAQCSIGDKDDLLAQYGDFKNLT